MKRSIYRGKPTYRTAFALEDGVCGNRIIAAIGGAKSTVDIATTHFRREDSHDALLAAIERKVAARLLLG